MNTYLVKRFDKRSLLNKVSDWLYYKYYFILGFRLHKWGEVLYLFATQSKELYYIYETKKLFEITWKNYNSNMSVDLGETALLKFKRTDKIYNLYTAEYFGKRSKRANTISYKNLSGPTN